MFDAWLSAVGPADSAGKIVGDGEDEGGVERLVGGGEIRRRLSRLIRHGVFLKELRFGKEEGRGMDIRSGGYDDDFAAMESGASMEKR